MKRKVLGKGIEAIISNRAPSISEKTISEIDIEDIFPNPFQPRKNFIPEKIQELANSIAVAGMIQPVVVYKKEEKYYLLVGERRWRAVQQLKWKKIPAIIKDLSIDDIMIGSLIENIQREDLNAIEIAEGIDMLMKKNGHTQEESSEKLGMNRTTLANYLRLLKLPEPVKQGIMSNVISAGHARSLLSLRNDEDILVAYQKITQNNLSVRQVETLVKNFYTVRKESHHHEDPNIIQMENRLTRQLSTKVKIGYSRDGKGKIEIFFNNLDEFERIYQTYFKE